MVCKVERV